MTFKLLTRVCMAHHVDRLLQRVSLGILIFPLHALISSYSSPFWIPLAEVVGAAVILQAFGLGAARAKRFQRTATWVEYLFSSGLPLHSTMTPPRFCETSRLCRFVLWYILLRCLVAARGLDGHYRYRQPYCLTTL